jgi:hypothetical protein
MTRTLAQVSAAKIECREPQQLTDVASLGGALGVLVMPAAIAAFLPIWRRRALTR